MSTAVEVTSVIKNASGLALAERPAVRGKFLFLGEEKLYIKGVTYGTFRPDETGAEFHDREKVNRDFSMMVECGINAVRVYTVPPRWLLDLAAGYGLFVMVGLPWEQHVTFLGDPKRADSIEQRIREGVRACAGHPAVLCYAIGNEIPASIVRWHGPKAVQRFLRRLYDAAKSEDPGALVTYVNFPTTEYLDLPWVDLFCFNVYLESRERQEAYLARLHNLAGDRPLIMAELGLDSLRNGERKQAETLGWQIRSCFASGCAGMFVFSWTDEWYRGGAEIEDWDFGLTSRDRESKLALAAVERAYHEVPFPRGVDWPRISVVVCSYNGSRTIKETLTRLGELDYPDYEVIVVDDGSTDNTAGIARQFDVRLISVPNGGLSRARNLGMEAAAGEIVAYIDDDAYPDPDWLRFLAHTFLTTDFAAVGGPNIPPPGDGPIAECVANSPGGPIHVLTSDREAEHIPGCNMAYRKSFLEAIGGFDPRFRAAGDDVDLCWRLMGHGGRIGFSPSAVVWHHRRNSVRTYWKQQIGYGKAEALLERKWPQKYSPLGHISWAGRIYNDALHLAGRRQRPLIYHGTWGLAPFQRLYPGDAGYLNGLVQTPEWHFANLTLLLLSGLGLLWAPLLAALPLLAISTLTPLVEAISRTGRFTYPSRPSSAWQRWKLRGLTTFLHTIQPVARLTGRLRHGLTPWRSRAKGVRALAWRRDEEIWSETWRAPEGWIVALEETLQDDGGLLVRGGEFDNWDLAVRAGICGGAKVRMALEDHGAGRQLARFQLWPTFSKAALLVTALFLVLALAAAMSGETMAAVLLVVLGGVPAVRSFHECNVASGVVRQAVRRFSEPLAHTSQR